MKRPGFKSVLSAGRRLWRKAKTDAQEPADDVGSQLQAANKLLQSRHFEDAESVLTAALTHHPDHPDLVECLARVAQRDGRWADALRHWQSLSAADPDRVEASVSQAKMLTKLRRPAEAEQVMGAARERWPDHPKVIEALALDAQRDKRWSDALAHWEDLTLRRPDHLNGWIRRIKTLAELKRPEEAADLLRGAMERWPNQPKLKEARALALEGEQQWFEALKCWRNLAVTHPSHAVSDVGQHIAMCEIKLGRVGAAGRSLEEAIGAREEAAIFERMFGSFAPFIPYYGMQIEAAFRDLAKAD